VPGFSFTILKYSQGAGFKTAKMQNENQRRDPFYVIIDGMMHIVDQRILGIAIVFLLGMLVIVKRIATGSILDKPKGNLMVQLVKHNRKMLFHCIEIIPRELKKFNEG